MSDRDETSDKVLATGPQCSTPKLTECSITGHQCIEQIALGVAQVPVIGYSFQACFEPGSCFERWALRRTVKIDVEIDLQLSDIIFEFTELPIEARGLVASGLDAAV